MQARLSNFEFMNFYDSPFRGEKERKEEKINTLAENK